jgi:hypothetical protein
MIIGNTVNHRTLGKISLNMGKNTLILRWEVVNISLSMIKVIFGVTYFQEIPMDCLSLILNGACSYHYNVLTVTSRALPSLWYNKKKMKKGRANRWGQARLYCINFLLEILVQTILSAYNGNFMGLTWWLRICLSCVKLIYMSRVWFPAQNTCKRVHVKH